MPNTMLQMAELDLQGKHVLIREDLNVPLKNGEITDDSRIKAALPTLKMAIAAKAKVMVMSHLGRPKEGVEEEQFSLAPVAQHLSELLEQPVSLKKHWLERITLSEGEIVLCENVRFNVGEKNNDPLLSQQMAALCDVFVTDAFATAHRAQGSTYGVAEYAPEVCAGPLLMKEVNALNKALEHPKKPFIAVVGGAKISTKLQLLESLLEKVDQLIVGGGIANTCLAAAGYEIGKSLYEPALVDTAKILLEREAIPLPVDVVVAEECSETATPRVVSIEEVNPQEMILDVGPQTQNHYKDIILQGGTILWNGPLGVFELPPFAAGTQAMAEAMASTTAFTLAGGGDTLAAIHQFKVEKDISYISTAGGAFLAFLEGKTLPAIAILEKRYKDR